MLGTRKANKKDSVTDEATEATSDDVTAIGEVQTKMQAAILLVSGLTPNTCCALAAAFATAGVSDDDMLRAITADEVREVMQTLAVFKDEPFPLFLPKNIGIKLRACAGATPPRKSPSQTTANSQHTTTAAAVAIDAIRPAAKLTDDADTARPGLVKTEDFVHSHVQAYAPYDCSLMQKYEELRSDWDMTKGAAVQLGCNTDPLVKQALAQYLTKNMGTAVYNTFVRPQLTKEDRECPIMLIWQLLAEARKVSEVDLSRRYTALLQPQRATTMAQLTTLYQQQIDEEMELRLHDFVTDRKCKSLKEAYLELSWNYPVLQTKLEIAWNGSRHDPPAALNLVKAEVVSYFSTQPETKVLAILPAKQNPVIKTPPVQSHGLPRILPTGRPMGSQATDNICRQFKSRGSCTYGDKCRYSHDKEALAMLAETHDSDEEDIVVEMFQQSNMAVAEPQITMAVINGISGFDSD